jgi:hypothetical protein
MAKSKYGVGAVSIPGINPEIGVTDLNPTKMLIPVPLQKEGPVDPEIVPEEYSGSLSGLFKFAQPQVEVELETGDEDDPSENVTVEFNELKDFQPKSIVERIPLLSNLTNQEEIIQKLVKLVNKNKKFNEILSDPEKKESLIQVLHSIVEELEAADE